MFTFLYKKTLYLLFIFPVSLVLSLEYGIDAKNAGNISIEHLQGFSERCAESNYIEHLLRNNFQLKKKFFYPYDWVRSFHKNPYYGDTEIFNPYLSFSRFIRTPWKRLEGTHCLHWNNLKKDNPLVDLNPLDGSLFDNVLQLRSAKTRNMLKIKDRVANIYFVNYETAHDYPEEVIAEIADLFGLIPNETFTPVNYYHKGQINEGIYKPKTYSPFSLEDLDFINEQLNEELEREIGYELIREPKFSQ